MHANKCLFEVHLTVLCTLWSFWHSTGNEMATSVTLQFTHYFTHICPKINLLPLVNPTEIPKKPTLTASLAANDTVHVILNPSATKINDKKITLISVPLVVVLVCFAAIMIIITVIVRCYYHRAISLRNETCSIKPPAIEEMYQTKGASYELDTWVHDDVKTKGSLAIKKMNLTDSTSDHLESQTSIHDDDIRTLVPPVITEKNQADGTSTDNDTRTYDHCRTMEPEIYQANGTNADLDTGIYDENGTTKSPVITEMNQANGTSDDLDTQAYDHIEPRNHQ